MLIFVSQWIVLESMPSSEDLFTNFQNAPIAYSTDNTIVIKNVKFNQTLSNSNEKGWSDASANK